MNTQKLDHVPAPWVAELGGEEITIEGRGNPSGTVAVLCGRKCAENFATARLIASAPEMLAALKGAQLALRKALPLIECPDDLTHNGTQSYCGEWLNEINEAIAKATGESV